MGKAVRIEELRGMITYLDEYLTMSARVAALSGDERWVRRYDEAEPRLDAVIDEAVALATPDVAAALSRTTDDANRRLIALERASFAKVHDGDRDAAWALLDGNEYARLKAVYAEGIAAFGDDLTALAASRTAILHRWAWLEACGLIMGGAILFVATIVAFRSGTRLRQILAHAEVIARQDPLTSLPNRLKFREHLEETISRLQKGGKHGAVHYLDLDGFKDVNDTFGHAAGDELLRAVSTRLQGQLRNGDLVARLGGDEFAIVQAEAAHVEMATGFATQVLQSNA